MTALNDAARLYIGASRISNAYVGTTMVWPRISSAFAVFDVTTASAVLITGGGLNIKNTGSGTIPSGARVADAHGKTTGKFYYEATLVQVTSGGSIGIGGIGTIGSTLDGIQFNGTTGVMLQSAGGQIWSVGGILGSVGTVGVSGQMAFAVDLDNRKFWSRLLPTNLWNGSSAANPATNVGGFTIPPGTMVPFVTFGGVSTGPNNIVKTNFGHYNFVSPVPSGFTAGWTV